MAFCHGREKGSIAPGRHPKRAFCRRMLGSKRAGSGIADKMIKYVLISILVSFLLVAFIMLALGFRTPYVPKKLDFLITSARFSNVCFAYQDEDTLRTYPGIIDYSRLTEEKVSECYYVEGKKTQAAYQLRIEYDASAQKEAEPLVLSTSNWHPSKEIKYARARPIILHKDGSMHKAKLTIRSQ